MRWGTWSFAFDQVSELGEGGDRWADHRVVVVSPIDCEELFRFIRLSKEYLSVPERDY